MRKLALGLVTACAFVVISGSVATAQSTQPVPRVVRITGVALDSITGTPLGGSIIQIADAAALTSRPQTATASADGVFLLDGIAPGRYVVAMYHPQLDHWKIDSPSLLLTVDSQSVPVVRLDLGASLSTIRARLCGDGLGADDGLVAGYVLDANTKAPVTAGTVTAFWREITVGSAGFHNDPRLRASDVAPDGWFVVCGVPIGVDVGLVAIAGTDSTSAIEVRIAGAGIVLRDVALAHRPDSSAASARAYVNGFVRSAGGEAITGARLKLSGSSASATTDERGRFSLATDRPGTQLLGTTALGYFPDQQSVDLYATEASELEIRLER
ncbi:MAG: carboxypeptidase-like regulatory domain-containing protein, partial [bacterium]